MSDLIIMAGGLLQIVAYGFQDVYLTTDPQITFFKVIYRRHTNFSIQIFEKTITESPDFGKHVKTKLYRLGDLATKMYLRVVINGITTRPGSRFAWVRRLGHAMINHVTCEIGGNMIDRHYGTWLDIWYELARQGKHDRGYAAQIGDVDELTAFNDKPKPQYTLYIPLQFWFNRNYGLALPLIAIQYHDIYIHVELEPNTKLLVRCDTFTNINQAKILEMGLVTDYIYLDADERKRFSVTGHEYLIEQTQYFQEVILTEPVKRLFLDFKHPTKEIMWAMRNGNYTSGKHFLCYSNKEVWTNEIIACTKMVLMQSMLVLKATTYIVDSSGNRIIDTPGEKPPKEGRWEEFEPGVISQLSSNGNLEVTNESIVNSLWINVDSLMVKKYSITNKIIAGILLTNANIPTIIEITGPLLDRDISVPLEQMTDTRVDKSGTVCVYQFSNYGLFITGKQNPLSNALLEYNGQNRVEKRNGRFYGTLQPWMHHSNTPTDGINLYSFATDPEKLQPTGSSNLSKIENIVLTLWFEDVTNRDNLFPPIDFIGQDTSVYIYCLSYNIFKIISGLTGLAYT